jgi:xanthine dehydrogenase accessory factor
MDSLNLESLRQALAWRDAGHAVALVWVVRTWGSAPRPAGALLALRADGVCTGSVSGGCVEDDLLHHAAHCTAQAHWRGYGGSGTGPWTELPGAWPRTWVPRELPCGARMLLWVQPLAADATAAWAPQLLREVAGQGGVALSIDFSSGVSRLVTETAHTAEVPAEAPVAPLWVTHWGPPWQLVVVGAGPLTQALVPMALALDFAVWVCDPRERHADVSWPPGVHRWAGMPDDAVLALVRSEHCAVLALTHDPKLDDLALIDALRSPAFYVGALGSSRNQTARRDRLTRHFGLLPTEVARLHGPVGMDIGARTPVEIAVAIAADLVRVRRQRWP